MDHQQYLMDAYPHLSGLLAQVSPLPTLNPQPHPVAEAVTKIVVGQMLSRSAAEKIFTRIVVTSASLKLEGCWQLSETDLLDCGLSRRKARTIREFAASYALNPSSFESWRDLDYLELSTEVSQHWGLSQWSADMLAIFHFAKPDVFPETDGTIIRVRRILEDRHLPGPLEPERASPFRTSLARYMWALLDGGHLTSVSSNAIL